MSRARQQAIVRLTLLVAASVGLFLLTRGAAAHVRTQGRADAAAWMVRGGEAARAGRTADAVAAYRRAVAHDRRNRDYTLALAAALARDAQPAAAERVLLAARVDAPEDSAINQALARLAADRGDVATAARYYRNALYAPWPSSEGPRAVRRELIELLLARDRPGDALPEILAAAAVLPDTVAARLELAGWLVEAGEPARARDEFLRVLRIEPRNQQAHQGAGLAAFALGDYAAAARHLRDAPAGSAAAHVQEVAALIVASDPLGPRLRAAERRRRLAAALDAAAARLRGCPDAALGSEHERFTRELPPRPDEERLAAGLALIGRIQAHARACGGAPSAADEALAAIVRLHADATP
jgi:Tfp pilus assembly protein PilF